MLVRLYTSNLLQDHYPYHKINHGSRRIWNEECRAESGLNQCSPLKQWKNPTPDCFLFLKDHHWQPHPLKPKYRNKSENKHQSHGEQQRSDQHLLFDSNKAILKR